MIYSWHEKAWQTITLHWNHQPNAWLFVGRHNSGKTTFARHLAHALLCENLQENHTPCQRCVSCELLSSGSHPDYYEITPEAKSESNTLQNIKIDAIRTLTEEASLSTYRGGRRVILIHPAESMNIQSANALLKLLEEPPEGTIFLLVSHARDRLLPTIKSRCRQMTLPLPDRETALHFLQNTPNATALLALHGGAPLFKIDEESEELRHNLITLLCQPRLLSILDFAVQFDQKKYPLEYFLNWLYKWLLDLGAVNQDMGVTFYPDKAETLQKLASKMDTIAILNLVDKILALIPYGQHTLSAKLQIESLLVDYLKLIY